MRRYDLLEVRIYATSRALGAATARDLAVELASAVAKDGSASVLLATANSQIQFFEALVERHDIPWDQVTVFHIDEYLGLPESHPASFRRQLRELLVDIVRPHAFHGIRGDAEDVERELQRYTELLRESPPCACVLGIGENGHLAFNDPPADFNTENAIHVVKLDEACRRQQTNEGHFPTLGTVPRQAISLTIPTLLRSPSLHVVVPELRKALAIKSALEGPISPLCPASILRNQRHAVMYLDQESSSLLA